MFDQELETATERLRSAVHRLGFNLPEEIAWNPIPFEGRWGFGTAAFFQVAAEEAKRGNGVRVPARAQEMADSVRSELGQVEGFTRVEAVRGYLNLYIDPPHYARRVVDTILQDGEGYGRGRPTDVRVMVEYSQPNTHKAMHVGHLRNTVLGGAMANILAFAGYDTVRANYMGDIGWHVIKWLWCYRRFHPGESPAEDRLRWLQEIYEEATRKVEENPEYEAEARRVYQRWNQGDAELKALWEQTRAWSLEGFNAIYAALGEHFDVFFFESEVEAPGKALIDDLIARGLAVDERPDGPVLVKLDELLGEEQENYRTLVLLTRDGTSLYGSKDLPLAIRKFEEWDIDRSIYVIDVRQSLYMRQIFKILELIGYEQAKDCYHLSYEIVNLPGNVTMSSREGTVVLFDDLLREATARAATIVEVKNPDLPEEAKREVARAVAVGGLKYAMLGVDNNRVVTFDWDRALDFEGQAAPYIQYAHVRASSILRRAEVIPPERLLPDYELEPAEIELLETLSRFEDEVQRAADGYKPLILATYAYDLARAFTSFYQACPVLQAEAARRDVRLRVTAAAQQTLANALRLLGIEAPSIM